MKQDVLNPATVCRYLDSLRLSISKAMPMSNITRLITFTPTTRTAHAINSVIESCKRSTRGTRSNH